MKFTFKTMAYAAALTAVGGELIKANKIDGYNYTSSWAESDWDASSGVTTPECRFAACFEGMGDDGEYHDNTLCADSKELLGKLLRRMDKSCGIYQTNDTDPLLDDCARIFVYCIGFKRGFFSDDPISATLCYHDGSVGPFKVNGKSKCLQEAIRDIIPPITTEDKYIFAGIGTGVTALLLGTCGVFALAKKKCQPAQKDSDVEEKIGEVPPELLHPSAPPMDKEDDSDPLIPPPFNPEVKRSM
jgi:hypothetical protein